MFDIEENIKNLPDKPGVYLHKDKYGTVIYVGKAVNLKNRVRSYFRSQTNMAPKVRSMVSNIAEFEYITTDSEKEALILECNLIKKYMPKYNVLLRDDKTYPYIKVTLGEEWPRITKTRTIKSDGSRYFGPYSDVGAVNETLDLLNSAFDLKKCSARSFPANHTPCLNYHIKQCKGVCKGYGDRDEYMKNVDRVIEFLSGRDTSIKKELKDEMMKASEELDFERAAKLRDLIAAADAVIEKQKVVLSGVRDTDIILVARSRKGINAVIFYVRDSKLSGRDSFLVDADPDDTDEEITASFIKQYYSAGMMIPSAIAVPDPSDEWEGLSEMLSDVRGGAVKILVPRRGEMKGLLDMAVRDVAEMVKTLDERVMIQQEKRDALTSELNRVFCSGTGIPQGGQSGRWRLEAYDISNTQGVDSVAGMVVFENGKPVRNDYRRFKIMTVDGPDDYASMQEVIYRRMKHELEEDRRFGKRPDMLLIDGGEGHVNAVQQVLDAMGIDIPAAGMVKDDKHRTRGLIFRGTEIDLRSRPVLFSYIGSIQEEVHRFSVDYHRGLRGRHLKRSLLDDIPGIGPRRRNSLLKKFGSIDAIKAASLEELSTADSMTTAAAEKIIEFFAGLNDN